VNSVVVTTVGFGFDDQEGNDSYCLSIRDGYAGRG